MINVLKKYYGNKYQDISFLKCVACGFEFFLGFSSIFFYHNGNTTNI